MTPNTINRQTLPIEVRAGHRDASVRAAAAESLEESAGEPTAVATILAWDSDPTVREALATASPKPRDHERPLAFLASDESAHIRMIAAKCSDAASTLARLSRDPDSAVRQAVADNPATRGEALNCLATSTTSAIRIAVARNSHCPDVTLDVLRRDFDEDVRRIADDRQAMRERDMEDRAGQDDYLREPYRHSLAVRDLLLTGSLEDALKLLVNRGVALEVPRLFAQPWLPPSEINRVADSLEIPDAVAMAIAANPAVEPDTLVELASTSSYMAHHGAGSRKWSERSCTALRNPSLPRDVLVACAVDGQLRWDSIGGYEIQAAWSNPALPTELLQDIPPNTSARLGAAVNPSAPPDLLAVLAEDDSQDVRRAVAENPRTPEAAIRSLAKRYSQDFGVGAGYYLATHPNLPADAAAPLMADFFFRMDYASSPHVPTATLVALARTDPDERVRASACLNLNTPDSVVEALADDEQLNAVPRLYGSVTFARENVRRARAEARIESDPLRRPQTVRDVAATFLGALSESQRNELALDAHFYSTAETAFILDVLSRDPLPRVRASIMGNRDCGEDIRARLADDRDQEVRQALAFYCSTPEVLLTLAQDPATHVHVVHNLSSPPGALETVLLDQASGVHGARRVAEHPNASEDLLDTLAASSDSATRQRVACHPACSGETLTRLADDPQAEVRAVVAAHRLTPQTILARLATDASPQVRRSVALNRHTQARVMGILTEDEDILVRQILAVSDRRDVRPWQALLLDTDQDTRALASEHMPADETERVAYAQAADTHPAMLEALAHDPIAQVRLAVAANASTPEHVAVTLASDSHQDVRRALATREHPSTEALAILAQDGAWGVRRAARAALRRAGRQ